MLKLLTYIPFSTTNNLVSPAFVISTGLEKPVAKVSNPIVWEKEQFKESKERKNIVVFIITGLVNNYTKLQIKRI